MAAGRARKIGAGIGVRRFNRVTKDFGRCACAERSNHDGLRGGVAIAANLAWLVNGGGVISDRRFWRKRGNLKHECDVFCRGKRIFTDARSLCPCYCGSLCRSFAVLYLGVGTRC